jgi:hypothetical protein
VRGVGTACSVGAVPVPPPEPADTVGPVDVL